jgi:hypothetical protein
MNQLQAKNAPLQTQFANENKCRNYCVLQKYMLLIYSSLQRLQVCKPLYTALQFANVILPL